MKGHNRQLRKVTCPFLSAIMSRSLRSNNNNSNVRAIRITRTLDNAVYGILLLAVHTNHAFDGLPLRFSTYHHRASNHRLIDSGNSLICLFKFVRYSEKKKTEYQVVAALEFIARLRKISK